MQFELGQKLIDKLRGKNKTPLISLLRNDWYNPFYGRVYPACYNLDFAISPETPEIYNKNGQRMDMFFLRDIHFAKAPYENHSKYFLWDRYNLGLKTHFYTHLNMLQTMGKPDNRYGLFIESESIVPKDYKIFDTHKGLEKDFDAIFTYSEPLLNKLDNAKFFPSCATLWYNITDKSSENYLHKTKNVSMVCSNKTWTKCQKIRHKFAYAANSYLDIYGQFNGGNWIEDKAIALDDYRYQLVIENDITPYYFTEKILDCFASQTIPIYLGATKIDDFFNSDGIIKIEEKDVDNIKNILAQCTEKDYEQRISAVKDNFARSLKYQNVNDNLYETFFLK